MILAPFAMAALLAWQDSPGAQDAAQQRPAVTSRTETDRTITTPKGTRLTVSSEAGDIVVKTWDRDAVRIQANHSSRMQVAAELKDQVLAITSSQLGARSVDYDLTVPVWMAVELESHYSSIEVDGVAGRVSAETVEGDITLRNLSGAVSAKSVEGTVKLDGGRGKVQLTTVQGDITVTKSSGDLEAETTDGDVTLTDVQASSIAVSTVDGEIRFSGPLQSSGRYEFTSHDGDISLTIPENSNATFGVRTFGDENRVHTSFAVKAVGDVRKGRRVTYALGTGSGAQVEVETFDGSFYLRKPGEAIKKGN